MPITTSYGHSATATMVRTSHEERHDQESLDSVDLVRSPGQFHRPSKDEPYQSRSPAHDAQEKQEFTLLYQQSPRSLKSHSQHESPKKDEIDASGFEGFSLLPKPQALNRDLEKSTRESFSFGPPIKITPGQFTRLSSKQSAAPPDDGSTQSLKKSPASGESNVRMQFPRNLPPVSPYDSPRKPGSLFEDRCERIFKGSKGQAQERTNHKLIDTTEPTVTRESPLRLPFPDSPPPTATNGPFPDSKSAYSAVHQLSSHKETQKKVSTKVRVPDSTLQTISESHPLERNVLPFEDDAQTSHHHLEHCQQGAYAMIENEVKDLKGEQQVVISTHGNCQSGREMTENSRSQMVSQPLRETVPSCQVYIPSQSRPQSRSSNISKQRFVCSRFAPLPN